MTSRDGELINPYNNHGLFSAGATVFVVCVMPVECWPRCQIGFEPPQNLKGVEMQQDYKLIFCSPIMEALIGEGNLLKANTSVFL